MPIELIPCGIYLAIALALGLLPGRLVSNSVAGYVSADRTLGTLLLYFILGATAFSSFAFLGGPGWIYTRGAAAFYIIAYGALGMVPLYFLGPRARRIGENLGLYTQAELVGRRFDSRALQLVLALVSLLLLIPYLTVQIKGVGYVLNVASHGLLPYWAGALIAYAVVTAYVLYSGVMGVGWTNVFMGIAMVSIGWLFGLYLPWKLYGGIQPMFESILRSGHRALLVPPGLDEKGQPWDWWSYSSAVVVSTLGLCCWPHLFMRSLAAKSDRSIKLMVVLYPTIQIFMIPVFLIGFAAIVKFPGVKPADTVLPFMLEHAGLSPWLAGLAFAGTLAASMHTGDAIMHSAGVVGVRDILKLLYPRRLSDRSERLLMQLVIVLFTALAYYFAESSQISLVGLLLASYAGVAQIFPVLLATLYWRGATGAGVLAGLLTGLGVSALFMYFPGWRPVPLHEGVYGLAANLAVMAAVSALTRRKALVPDAYLQPGLD